MIKRIVLFLFVIIFVNLCLLFFLVIDDPWKALTDSFGDPLVAIAILGMSVILVVGLIFLKISGGKY